MNKCISPEFDEDCESCRTCMFENIYAEMPCYVPDTKIDDNRKQGAFLLDVSYTMTCLCDIISTKLGCTKCMYFDAETHDCDVRKQINDLKEKATVLLRGDNA